jgi:hypothetical protein
MMTGEGCDDNDSTDGKGCKADCSGPLDGWSCTGGSTTTPVTCTPICGDGRINAPE